MKELIDDIKNKKPINVIYDGKDHGNYYYNENKERYEGVIGYLTLDQVKKVLKKEIDFIKLERGKNE